MPELVGVKVGKVWVPGLTWAAFMSTWDHVRGLLVGVDGGAHHMPSSLSPRNQEGSLEGTGHFPEKHWRSLPHLFIRAGL